MAFHLPKNHRVRHPLTGEVGDEFNGFFIFKKNGVEYRVLASNGEGWEHVSVSLNKKRCPDWEEMCMIKDMFWDAEDCVLQYHPPKDSYVSFHPYCLHLWRPINQEIPVPPTYTVGPK